MKILFSITLLLGFCKLYTSNLKSKCNQENSNLSAFVKFDFEKFEYKLQNQKFEIIALSKFSTNRHEATIDLLEALKSYENQDFEEVKKVFNVSSLRKIIDFDSLKLTNNKGLSMNQNKLLALSQGYNSIIKKLSIENESNFNMRPYLIGLKRKTNYMDLTFKYALSGKVKGVQFAHEEEAMNIDELPVNIGIFEGVVSFTFFDSITKEKRCYKKSYLCH